MIYFLISIIAVETFLIFLLQFKITNLMAIKKDYFKIKNKFNSILQLINTKFIFNSFSMINTLCYEDTYKAQLVNSNLSNFTRGLFQLLLKDKIVDFKNEYYYLNSFLQIEEIHLKDKLTVESEINYTDFELPSYSLNLITQDFIYYSFYLRKITGNYTLKVNREKNKVIISQNINSLYLSDSEKKAWFNHDQIQNSFKRISEKCHGCVTIDSNIESGTTVKIELPVEGKDNEYSGS